MPLIKQMNKSFELKLLSLYWLENMNEEIDLCAHGKLLVKIGDEIICDEDIFEITVSSTALYLMRTLDEDYKKGDYASQLLPCCGFNFYAESKEDDFVNVLGCPSGIDWTIIHTDDTVKLITEKGTEAVMNFENYKEIVLDFADKIKSFYNESKPKIVEEQNEMNVIGYPAFWNEWNKLRGKWK